MDSGELGIEIKKKRVRNHRCYCGKSYFSPEAFMTHVRNFHRLILKQTPPTEDSTKFTTKSTTDNHSDLFSYPYDEVRVPVKRPQTWSISRQSDISVKNPFNPSQISSKSHQSAGGVNETNEESAKNKRKSIGYDNAKRVTNCSDQPKTCDDVLFEFIKECNEKDSSNTHDSNFNSSIMFRECVNLFYSMVDKNSSKQEEYTLSSSPYLLPKFANIYILKYLPKTGKNFSIKLETNFVVRLCEWLYAKKYTELSVSLPNF